MKKNLLYAQSGGVTPVINATACGVIETARQNRDKIGKVYAGKDGILGPIDLHRRVEASALHPFQRSWRTGQPRQQRQGLAGQRQAQVEACLVRLRRPAAVDQKSRPGDQRRGGRPHVDDGTHDVLDLADPA